MTKNKVKGQFNFWEFKNINLEYESVGTGVCVCAQAFV